MGIGLILAATALFVSAVGTAFSAKQTSEASKETRKAERRKRAVDQRIVRLQTQRRTRQAIAARNKERARLVASAETGGLGTSTGLAGAVGALRTQTAANIGFSNSIIGAQNLRADIGLRGFLNSNKLLARSNLTEGVTDIVSSSLTFGSDAALGRFA